MTWQPIETAPKDGTEVLCWCPSAAMVPVVMHFSSAEYFEREYGDAEYIEEGWHLSYSYPNGLAECTWEPTHWMPLPEPPK